MQRDTIQSECGKLGIVFTLRNLQDIDSEAISKLFYWDIDSFSIQNLPKNAYNLIGEYKISFSIWLIDHPNISLSDSSQEFTVKVIDPCADEYSDKRPNFW